MANHQNFSGISSICEIVEQEDRRLKTMRDHPEKSPKIVRRELASDLRRVAFILEKDTNGLESAAWRLADTLGFIAELTGWQGPGIDSFTGLGYRIVKDIPANSQKSESEQIDYPEEVCK